MVQKTPSKPFRLLLHQERYLLSKERKMSFEEKIFFTVRTPLNVDVRTTADY